MTTKFNQGMYARMRAKKNEPLSNIGTRAVRVTDKGASVTTGTPVTPGIETIRMASLATSVEEIIPQRKRLRTDEKGKEKADSCSSSVWDDAGVALARAQESFTAEDMKAFSSLSPNEIVNRHLHKLVQVLGESLHITSEFLSQETKV